MENKQLNEIEDKLSSLEDDFDNKRIEFEEYIRTRSILISKKERILTKSKIK